MRASLATQPRSGFKSALSFELRYERERFDAYFMALELRPEALASMSGMVRYHPKFDGV